MTRVTISCQRQAGNGQRQHDQRLAGNRREKPVPLAGEVVSGEACIVDIIPGRRSRQTRSSSIYDTIAFYPG